MRTFTAAEARMLCDSRRNGNYKTVHALYLIFRNVCYGVPHVSFEPDDLNSDAITELEELGYKVSYKTDCKRFWVEF